MPGTRKSSTTDITCRNGAITWSLRFSSSSCSIAWNDWSRITYSWNWSTPDRKKKPASTAKSVITAYATGETNSEFSSRPAIAPTCFTAAPPRRHRRALRLRAPWCARRSPRDSRPPLLQLRERRVERLLAAVHDDHALTDRLDLGKDVRRQDHRARLAFARARQIADQRADLADLDRVEADGRLVEDQHRRIVHDRLGESDALAIALRERADHAATHVRETAAFERAVDRSAPLRGAARPSASRRSRDSPRRSSRDRAAGSRAGIRWRAARRAGRRRCRGRRSPRGRRSAAGSR